jgi:GlpG protein
VRLIGTIANENQAAKISSFLQRKGIENRCEPSFEGTSGLMQYHLWVMDEDRLAEAAAHFFRFQKTPFDPEFDLVIEKIKIDEPAAISSEDMEEEEELVERKSWTPVTLFFLSVSIFLFLWNGVEEISMSQAGFLERPFAMTSLQADLMYDLPAPFENFQKAMQGSIDTPVDTSYWQGFYEWLIIKLNHGNSEGVEGPLFVKISQGQIWRLFSPCLLHGGFFHILFNMLWLWFLGRPIEERIGWFRTLILTLFIGILSNTAQYFMSGPLFFGYSGIVMGLATFIWMRQKNAPWEGYPLSRSTILFLFLFIGAIFILTFASFLIQLFTPITFSPNIANTAHIMGGLIGAILGRLKFFAARSLKS